MAPLAGIAAVVAVMLSGGLVLAAVAWSDCCGGRARRGRVASAVVGALTRAVGSAWRLLAGRAAGRRSREV